MLSNSWATSLHFVNYFSKEGELKVKPLQVVITRVIKKNNQNVAQVLVQWEGFAVEEATWEDKQSLELQFPKVILEDNNLEKERDLS